MATNKTKVIFNGNSSQEHCYNFSHNIGSIITSSSSNLEFHRINMQFIGNSIPKDDLIGTAVFIKLMALLYHLTIQLFRLNTTLVSIMVE